MTIGRQPHRLDLAQWHSGVLGTQPSEPDDRSFSKSLQNLQSFGIVSFLGAFQIGIRQSLSDRLRISVFKAGGKSTEANGLDSHVVCFLREVAHAISSRSGKMILHAGQ